MTTLGYRTVGDRSYVHNHPDWLTVTDICQSCAVAIVTHQPRRSIRHVRECAACLSRSWDKESKRWR